MQILITANLNIVTQTLTTGKILLAVIQLLLDIAPALMQILITTNLNIVSQRTRILLAVIPLLLLLDVAMHGDEMKKSLNLAMITCDVA